MKSSFPSFADQLIASAKAEGFPIVGALDLESADISEHWNRYKDWISAGYGGKMQYLVRGLDRREDLKRVFPQAQSILCVALPYSSLPAGATDSNQGPRYARYLRGPDYHHEIGDRLDRAMTHLKRNFPTLEWKTCVDTSAVLERSWAALAGLGWIGKNTLLIHPQFGSYLLLGEVLLSLKVNRGPSPLRDFCGNCSRCLEACPTKAFPQAHMLDSTRCISYSTLELRGEWRPRNEERAPWVAGCDICQEVCPFNTKVTNAPLVQPDGSTSLQIWKDLLEETEVSYVERVSRSSLNRVKPAQFRRNLALSLAASASFELLPLKGLLEKKCSDETDPDAKWAWNECLENFSQLEEKRRP